VTRFLDYVPQSAKEYFKLFRLRRRYPDCKIYSPLVSTGVSLGRECLISRDVEVGPNVSIGDFSYVNAGSIIASGRIGRFCSIGYFCQIGLPEHPLSYLSTSPRIYGSRNIFGTSAYWDDYPSPPEIDNDVWIGSQALILQNVHIGNGAVIAGGAVVTGNVAPYTIVAGVPAKEVRKRFTEPTIEMLLKLEWWNMPIQELERLRHLFELKEQTINELLEYLP
jgi:virginiamycin A acetyltransferase